MSKVAQSGEIRLIPIERIEVLNTRERNQAAFDEIVENIRTIGLKKPITVTPRKGVNGCLFPRKSGVGIKPDVVTRGSRRTALILL